MRTLRFSLFAVALSMVATGCSRRPPTLRGVSVDNGRGCGISKKGEVWCFPGLGLDPTAKVTRAEIVSRDADELALVGRTVYLRRGERVDCVGNCEAPPFVGSAAKLHGGDTLWVQDTQGALANMDSATRSWTTRVSKDVVDFATGVGGYAYKRKDGAVFSQGRFDTSPVEVPSFRGALSLAVGGAHVCAVLPLGTVECFGSNDFGQLGDGTTTSRKEPRAVTGLEGVVEVSAGDDFSCARLGNATVSCWGNNEFSQLTSGSPGDRVLTPRPVVGIFGATALASSGQGSCAALGQEEGARCWGRGTFGIPSAESNLRVPMPVRFPKK